MADLTAFEQYYKRGDRLIEQSTKEQLAESARLLALNVAHHQIKHGEIPLDKTLARFETVEPNDEQLKLLVKGMENLVGVLGNVISGLESMQNRGKALRAGDMIGIVTENRRFPTGLDTSFRFA